MNPGPTPGPTPRPPEMEDVIQRPRTAYTTEFSGALVCIYVVMIVILPPPCLRQVFYRKLHQLDDG